MNFPNTGCLFITDVHRININFLQKGRNFRSYHTVCGEISEFWSRKMSMQEGEIKNRVAESALLQICPEDWYDLRPRYNFDLADFLYQGLILKELDFRAALREINWSAYQDGIICLYCSADAIVPTWAFMLVSVHAAPFAEVIFSSPAQLDEFLFDRIIQQLVPKTPCRSAYI